MDTLEENRPELKSLGVPFGVATNPVELFGLAISILRLCCKSTLEQARICLRTRWCQ